MLQRNPESNSMLGPAEVTHAMQKTSHTTSWRLTDSRIPRILRIAAIREMKLEIGNRALPVREAANQKP